MINRRAIKSGISALGLLAGLEFATLPEAFAQERKKPEVHLGYEQSRNPLGHNPKGSSPYSSASQLPIAQPGARPPAYAPGYFPNAAYPYPYNFPMQGGFYGRGVQASGAIFWTPQQQSPVQDWEEYVEDAIASDLVAIEKKLGRRFFQRNRMDSEGNLHDFIIYETYGLPGSTDATVARVIDVAKKNKKVAKGTDDRKMDEAYAMYQEHYWGIRGIKYLFVNVSDIKNMTDLSKTQAFVVAFVMPGLNFDFHTEPEIRIKDEGLYRGSRKELRDKKPEQ